MPDKNEQFGKDAIRVEEYHQGKTWLEKTNNNKHWVTDVNERAGILNQWQKYVD